MPRAVTFEGDLMSGTGVPLHRTKRPTRGILRVFHQVLNTTPNDNSRRDDHRSKSKSTHNLCQTSERHRLEKTLDRGPRPKPGENLKVFDLGGSTRSRSKSGSKPTHRPVTDARPSSQFAPAAAQIHYYAPEATTSRRDERLPHLTSIYAPPNPAASLQPNTVQQSYRERRPSTSQNVQQSQLVIIMPPPPHAGHEQSSHATGAASQGPGWHITTLYPPTTAQQTVPPPPRSRLPPGLDHVPARPQYRLHDHLRNAYLSWDVTRNPSEARYGQYRELPEFDSLAVTLGVSKLIIYFSNSRLSRWKIRWETLVVRAPHGGAVTVRHVLNAIHDYFNQRMHRSEYEMESPDVYNRLMADVANRGSLHRDPLRLDTLRGSTRFSGLTVRSAHHGEVSLSLSFSK